MQRYSEVVTFILDLLLCEEVAELHFFNGGLAEHFLCYCDPAGDPGIVSGGDCLQGCAQAAESSCHESATPQLSSTCESQRSAQLTAGLGDISSHFDLRLESL